MDLWDAQVRSLDNDEPLFTTDDERHYGWHRCTRCTANYRDDGSAPSICGDCGRS